ncbi:MAG: hypothetical protein AAGE83_08000 [Pseudomonadota bacterium]
MLQPLDWTQITILMVFGGVFALVGLYMLLRPPPSDGETKIELFGLKFNASSGGLLVFIVGCGFLASPTFIPKAATPSAPASTGGAVASRDASAAAVAGAVAIAAGAEVEPNDHPRGANIIEVGSAYSGLVEHGDIDLFEAPIREGTRELRYVWRLLSGEGNFSGYQQCVMSLLDEHGSRLEIQRSAPAIGEAASNAVTVAGNAAVGVKVAAEENASCGYEIELRYE